MVGAQNPGGHGFVDSVRMVKEQFISGSLVLQIVELW